MSGRDGSGAGDWRARARAAANRPPLRPREPLHLDVEGRAVHVGSIERDLAQRMAAARLPLRPLGLAPGGAASEPGARAGPAAEAWLVDAPVVPSLATIAAWLHDAGLAAPWRDERLAVVDSEQRAVAEIERGVVRVLGLTTYAVHLVGRSSDGQGVWVQQRACDKATDPGKWDTLMGGQVAAGETLESALARETQEEAGLDVAALFDLRRGQRLTVRRPVEEGYMIEHIDVYAARLPAGTVPCNQDGEVQRFDCLDGARLDDWLARGEFTLEATLILAGLLSPRG